MDQLTPVGVAVDDEVERDLPFNPYRFAASANAKGIITEAIGLVLNYERHRKLRRNKRRPNDKQTFDQTVDAVLSDLMHHHLVGHRGDVYVSRSNRFLGGKNRYRSPVYSKAFPDTLDLLNATEMGYIEQDVAVDVQGASRSTVIRPGWRLLDRITEHEIGLHDLDEQQIGETIVLKRSKDPDDYWDEGGWQEYEDDELTHRYRVELADINQWLAEANLKFDWQGLPWPHTEFAIRDRRLRRVFTQGRFDSGGRLFGGFWQRLRKEERRMGLSISGEKAVELDYGQVGPRIIYGLAGHKPPFNDLYDIWGHGHQRGGVKKVMSAMIFASARLDRFPKETRKLFPRSSKIGDVVNQIERRHPLIADRFYRGLGHDAQFIESQIMVEVLLALKQQDIFALPIHDAVMVPASAIIPAMKVMLSTFHKRTGIEGIVTDGS